MSEPVVVDASVAIKWVLEEADSEMAQALLDGWISEKKVILAPALLAYEITNIVYRKSLKGEISLDRAKQSIQAILETDLQLDYPEDAELCLRSIELAKRFNLPAAYDAQYLALAEREECDLWTADARLWNAVKGKINWVKWLGEYQH